MVGVLEAALTELERQGIRGLVIDLRNNPGGLLDAAIDVIEHQGEAAVRVVDVAHRASLMYSFGAMVILNFIQFSPFPFVVTFIAVAAPLFFFLGAAGRPRRGTPRRSQRSVHPGLRHPAGRGPGGRRATGCHGRRHRRGC